MNAKLNGRLQVLLHDAARTIGWKTPEQMLSYIEEQLTASEYTKLHKFLTWLLANKKTYGHNLPEVYTDFVKSEFRSAIVKSIPVGAAAPGA